MFAQFKAHLQWRTEFGVDAILDEDFSGTHDQENLCLRDCCFWSICLPALLSSGTTQENKTSCKCTPCVLNLVEPLADLKSHKEIYWGGVDKTGVMTLMWILRKHDPARTDAKRFVRFFVHQIECGLRSRETYPNGKVLRRESL